VPVELTQNRDDCSSSRATSTAPRRSRILIESKAVRRGLSLKIFDWGKVEEAGGNKVRQQIGLRAG
jgi:uncharacterized protein YajQ (UPF0234 family)